jgi:hypothetical protein
MLLQVNQQVRLQYSHHIKFYVYIGGGAINFNINFMFPGTSKQNHAY